jgi:glycosyltransferase involved in cell wall biosynthesis
VVSISVVIPVYNSEAILPNLLAALDSTLPGLADEFEVILVNDGSRDGSWKRIQELGTQYPFVRGLDLMRNYGQHNAVLAGIRIAQKEVIVTMDDDLQHPPAEVSKLLAKLDEGFDVVYGVPEREQHGLLRDLASQVTKLALQNAMGANTARSISAFRAFRTQLRDGFDRYQGSFVSIDVLLTWATTRFVGIKVRHDERKVGVSNYTVRKLFTHALNMLTGFSVLPLQIASFLGFACTLFGLLLLCYVFYNYFVLNGRIPGFTFIVSTVAVFSGAQLFALGIIGEYLARAHFRLMDKPSYTVRQRAGRIDTTSSPVGIHRQVAAVVPPQPAHPPVRPSIQSE